MAAVIAAVEPLAALVPGWPEALAALNEAHALVDDAARALARYDGADGFDPNRLDEIEGRLFELSRLSRKHGGTLDAVIARRADIVNALEEFEDEAGTLAGRQKAVDKAQSAALAVAKKLTARRKKAARLLAGVMDATLADLSMPTARMRIEVLALGDEDINPAETSDRAPKEGAPSKAFNAFGQDKVAFLFAPNLGVPGGPLAKIASGASCRG